MAKSFDPICINWAMGQLGIWNVERQGGSRATLYTILMLRSLNHSAIYGGAWLAGISWGMGWVMDDG